MRVYIHKLIKIIFQTSHCSNNPINSYQIYKNKNWYIIDLIKKKKKKCIILKPLLSIYTIICKKRNNINRKIIALLSYPSTQAYSIISKGKTKKFKRIRMMKKTEKGIQTQWNMDGSSCT